MNYQDNILYSISEMPLKQILYRLTLTDLLSVTRTSRYLRKLARGLINELMPETYDIDILIRFLKYIYKTSHTGESSHERIIRTMQGTLRYSSMLQVWHTSIIESFILIWDGSRHNIMREVMSWSKVSIIPWYYLAYVKPIAISMKNIPCVNIKLDPVKLDYVPIPHFPEYLVDTPMYHYVQSLIGKLAIAGRYDESDKYIKRRLKAESVIEDLKTMNSYISFNADDDVRISHFDNISKNGPSYLKGRSIREEVLGKLK